MSRRLSARTAALLGLGGLLLFMGWGGWLVQRYVHESLVARRAVEHTYAVLDAVAETRLALLRGRLSTAHAMALRVPDDPFRLAEAPVDAPAALARLRDLLDGSPAQLAQVERLAAAIAEWLAMTRTVTDRLAGDEFEAALRAYEQGGIGRGRAILDDIVVEERRLLAARDAQSQRSMDHLTTLLMGAFLLAAACAASTVIVLVLKLRAGTAQQFSLEAARRLSEAASQQVAHSQKQLQSILSSARDVIFVIDPQGRVALANEACAELFGVPPAELVGAPATILVPDLSHLEPRRGEVTALRTDGSRFTAEISIGTFVMDGDTHAVCILRDISERQRLDQLKNEFISTVSHELRTPLTSIRGALGLIVGGAAGELAEKATALVEIAHKNSLRLANLVNDILDIEKIEAGRLEFRKERIDLRTVTRNAVESVEPFAGQYGITLEIAAEPAVAVEVEGDPDRLTQVVTNLLSNATKFSPNGGTVRILIHADEDHVRVSVEDHGPGLPESLKPRLFQRFAQADTSDVRRTGGTGLGLSIAKAIVERHDGTIGYESPYFGDHGTRFWIELPRLEPEVVRPREPLRRVLICEDDADIANLLVLLLAQDGWGADVARDAESALALLRSRPYHAATIDLMLPGTDGLELIRRIRAEPGLEHLPVAVVSGRADVGRNLPASDELGVVDWLEKPIDHDRLRRSLLRATEADPSAVAEILHVEDDDDVVAVLAAMLEGRARIVQAPTLGEARRRLADRRFALVIVDVALPDGSGLELLTELQRTYPGTPVLILSAGDYDEEEAGMVSAALVKGRADHQQLAAVINRLIGDAAFPENVGSA